MKRVSQLSGRKTLGLTLIELVVAMAIFGILLQAAVPMFTTALGSMRSHSASERLLDDLMWAQSMAISRDTTLTVAFNTNNCAWSISQGATVLRCLSNQDFSNSYSTVNVTVNPSGGNLSINPSGQFSGSPSVQFASGNGGKKWTLSVLGSGKTTITAS